MTNSVIVPGSADEVSANIAPAHLDALYESLREEIFTEVQKYHTSPDYIPVRREIKLKGDGIVNSQKSGSKLFSQLHEAAFEKHPHYRCTTCRDAFTHYYGLVFISRTGVQVNPLANVLEARKIDTSFKKVVDIDRKSISSTDLVLVENINAMTSVDTHGGFSHYRFFTEEQVKESILLGPIDHQSTAGLLNYVKKVSATNLRALINAIQATAGKTDHLGGILHFADFAEEMLTIAGDNVRELWVTQMLRTSKWATLRHFSASFAGTVLDMYLNGHSVQAIADFYLEKSDPALFKQKQADAKEGLLKATRDFLQKNEITGILSRRFAVVGLDNVPTDWVLAKKAEEVKPVATGTPGVIDAFDTLMGKAAKKEGIGGVEGLADLNMHYLTREDIDKNLLLRTKHRKIDMVSRKHIVEEIFPNAAEIFVALDEYSKMRWVTLFTESEATPNAISFFNPAQVREIEGYGVVNGLVLQSPLVMADITQSIYGGVRYYLKVINAVTIAGATALSIEGGKKISKGIFGSNTFPTIVGAEIANEHYGMAAAVRDVSEHIGVVGAPEGQDGAEAFCGVMMDVNTTIVAVMKDGTIMVCAISANH